MPAHVHSRCVKSGQRVADWGFYVLVHSASAPMGERLVADVEITGCASWLNLIPPPPTRTKTTKNVSTHLPHRSGVGPEGPVSRAEPCTLPTAKRCTLHTPSGQVTWSYRKTRHVRTVGTARTVEFSNCIGTRHTFCRRQIDRKNRPRQNVAFASHLEQVQRVPAGDRTRMTLQLQGLQTNYIPRTHRDNASASISQRPFGFLR